MSKTKIKNVDKKAENLIRRNRKILLKEILARVKHSMSTTKEKPSIEGLVGDSQNHIQDLLDKKWEEAQGKVSWFYKEKKDNKSKPKLSSYNNDTSLDSNKMLELIKTKKIFKIIKTKGNEKKLNRIRKNKKIESFESPHTFEPHFFKLQGNKDKEENNNFADFLGEKQDDQTGKAPDSNFENILKFMLNEFDRLNPPKVDEVTQSKIFH